MAKKLGTNKTHFEQINLTLVYIDQNYSTDITVKELATISGYSLFHFHKIFKEIVGENVNSYIRNTRLEKASNLLLYNQHKTIKNIAIDTGFTTSTGFTASFKKKFGLTPKEWRKSGYENKSFSEASIIEIKENINVGTPEIVKEAKIPILYMRVYGYEKDVSKTWKKMVAWADEFDMLEKPHRYIGLFHNHPSFTPYSNARYLACIQNLSNAFRSGRVGKCTISSGRFAKFQFKCKHDKLYKMMHATYIKWLQNSDYEVRNFPAYVEYKNPKELVKNGVLDIDFYMPIQLKS
ncbi:hypothetical protein CRV02_13255 [Arcobacter sp. CECT 8989]|nr:helix-turn-helix domain-containing protein [Arcobacter sp. CECT 8989]RXJ98455.1 hypothetical protein CRV02_13255 [Arcobacter sp. CECT 8989]